MKFFNFSSSRHPFNVCLLSGIMYSVSLAFFLKFSYTLSRYFFLCNGSLMAAVCQSFFMMRIFVRFKQSHRIIYLNSPSPMAKASIGKEPRLFAFCKIFSVSVPRNVLRRLDEEFNKKLVDADPTLLIRFSVKFSKPPEDFLLKNFLLFCLLPLDNDLHEFAASDVNELRRALGLPDEINASVDFIVESLVPVR